jgi:hypothetical protein
MKLSIEASSSALTTKLFIRMRSLPKYSIFSSKKVNEGLNCWALMSDLRIGTRVLMMLYNLKIQMNLILVPLLKISSNGI